MNGSERMPEHAAAEAGGMTLDQERSLLRRAVLTMRDEWSEMTGGAWHKVQSFHYEVAAWLETELECESPPEWEAQRHEDLSWHHALRIGRAYLGSAS